MEKLLYPLANMRITQHYNGKHNHYKHSGGKPADYAIDDGGKDGGSDIIYAPCTCTPVRIYGVSASGVNTLWLTSVDKVQLACGTVDYVTVMIEHCPDKSLKKLRLGQAIKQGDEMCCEGADGATGNHIHMSVGRGKIKGNGWVKNDRGVYVLTTTGGVYLPQNAFFVDESKTKILDDGGIAWKKIAKTAEPIAKGADFATKAWKNGSTLEPVYSSVDDCEAGKDAIGMIAAKGRATCTDIVGDCYLVHYAVGENIKCGFVKYHGGVK